MSLDVLRGLTVAMMILVNNGSGESFSQLEHAKWNGMTVCDLVFPFFLFMMGISTYLSLKKTQFQATPEVLRKIFKRGILLFLILLGALVEIELDAEGGADCLLCEVVAGRTEAAGRDDDGGAALGNLHAVAQTPGVVPHHGMPAYVHPDLAHEL